MDFADYAEDVDGLSADGKCVLMYLLDMLPFAEGLYKALPSSLSAKVFYQMLALLEAKLNESWSVSMDELYAIESLPAYDHDKLNNIIGVLCPAVGSIDNDAKQLGKPEYLGKISNALHQDCLAINLLVLHMPTT
jgi:hypothetical protein